MITQSIETITPEIASLILEQQINNRPLSDRAVATYASAMKMGKWNIGPPLLFNGLGGWSGLIDGQHRIAAVKRAKTAVSFAVIRGLDSSVFKDVDVGKKRSVQDLLVIMKSKNPGVVGSIAKVILAVEAGHEPWDLSNVRLMPGDIAHRAANDPLIQMIGSDLMGKYASVRKITHSLGTTGWLMYELSKYPDQTKVADFFLTLGGKSVPADATDPAFALRNRMTEDALAKRKMGRKERSAIMVKAWNYYANNQPVKLLKFAAFGRTRESFPTLFVG